MHAATLTGENLVGPAAGGSLSALNIRRCSALLMNTNIIISNHPIAILITDGTSHRWQLSAALTTHHSLLKLNAQAWVSESQLQLDRSKEFADGLGGCVGFCNYLHHLVAGSRLHQRLNADLRNL